MSSDSDSSISDSSDEVDESISNIEISESRIDFNKVDHRMWIANARQAFLLFDTDDSGFIGKSELKTALNLLNQDYDDDKLDGMFNNVKRNSQVDPPELGLELEEEEAAVVPTGGGTSAPRNKVVPHDVISQAEFVQYYVGIVEADPNTKSLWSIFDSNGDGFITAADVERVCNECNAQVSLEKSLFNTHCLP